MLIAEVYITYCISTDTKEMQNVRNRLREEACHVRGKGQLWCERALGVWGLLELNFMPTGRGLGLFYRAFVLDSHLLRIKRRERGEFSTPVGDVSLLSSPAQPCVGCHLCIKYRNQRENYCTLRRIVTLTSLNKKSILSCLQALSYKTL